MLKQMRLVKGETIPNPVLQEDLDWLNQNPFRSVQAVFERGEEVGQTDLTLRVNDPFPLRFYGGFDDSGDASTVDERIYAGFNSGNFLELDHQLSYRDTTSADFTDFKAHAGILRYPFALAPHAHFFRFPRHHTTGPCRDHGLRGRVGAILGK